MGGRARADGWPGWPGKAAGLLGPLATGLLADWVCFVVIGLVDGVDCLLGGRPLDWRWELGGPA
jgi:hypothetical protein